MIYGVYKLREKFVYKFPVGLIETRENGGIKEIDGLKGGYVKNKTGVRDFEVKHGKYFWQRKKLGFSPDPTQTDLDGKFTFIKIGDGSSFQQVKKTLVTHRVIDNGEEKIQYELLVEPIPTDVKTATINQIHATENLLDKNRLTAYGITILGFVIMVIVQIAFLWFVHRKGG